MCSFNHLPSVRTPTLVLAGEHTTTRIVGLNEPCSTAESFKIIADRIPGSSFEVVPGSHFYPMVRCFRLLLDVWSHVASAHSLPDVVTMLLLLACVFGWLAQEHPEHLAHKVVDYLRKVLKLPSSESKL